MNHRVAADLRLLVKKATVDEPGLYDRWKQLPLPLRVTTGVGTVAAGAGLLGVLGLIGAYKMRPKRTEAWVQRRGLDVVSNLEAAAKKTKKIPNMDIGPWALRGSLSATGPGVMFGRRDAPLQLKADMGGLPSVMHTFSKDTGRDVIEKLGIMSPEALRKLHELAPPQMYFGLEVSPNPFAFGVVIDKKNAGKVHESFVKLKKLQKQNVIEAEERANQERQNGKDSNRH